MDRIRDTVGEAAGKTAGSAILDRIRDTVGTIVGEIAGRTVLDSIPEGDEDAEESEVDHTPVADRPAASSSYALPPADPVSSVLAVGPTLYEFSIQYFKFL